MTRLDITPLTASVTKEEVAAFKREARAVGGGYSAVSATSIVGIIVTVVAVAVFATTMFGFTVSTGGSPSESIILAVVAAVVIGGFLVICRMVSQGTWRRWLRLTRFGTANGLGYAANAPSPGYPGAIFGLGRAQQVPEHLFRGGDRALDLGNYRYTTGSGKNRKTHDWGYVAIKLDRMLPQMILDAKANNFLGTNLPLSFSRDQVLSLEGDFDRYFTLYCPKEYERDALYVFTPDLMARLVDEAALFDVEIVDDWMFLYSAKTFDLADPQAIARLFRIVDSVGDRTLSRTQRYADSKLAGADGALPAASGPPLGSRMAVNRIASQGRRLKRGVPIVGIIVFVAIAAFWAVNFLPFFRSV
jgi:hypothetical protein